MGNLSAHIYIIVQKTINADLSHYEISIRMINYDDKIVNCNHKVK